MGRDGHITAPVKPDGGVRGSVVGVVGTHNGVAATALLQYAQSTRAGCECVAHVMQALTDLNPEATVVPIDGIRGMRSDLPERGAGRLVADGKWRSGAPIRAQFLRALVDICAERGEEGRDGHRTRRKEGSRGTL